MIRHDADIHAGIGTASFCTAAEDDRRTVIQRIGSGRGGVGPHIESGDAVLAALRLGDAILTVDDRRGDEAGGGAETERLRV